VKDVAMEPGAGMGPIRAHTSYWDSKVAATELGRREAEAILKRR